MEDRELVAGKYMSSVKVGPKGQIVIPKEARELFHIQPGDTLLLLADVERGIAIQRFEYFNKFAEDIFQKKEESQEKSEQSSDNAKQFSENRKRTEEQSFLNKINEAKKDADKKSN